MTREQLIHEFEALPREEQESLALAIEQRLKANDAPENGAAHDTRGEAEAQRERRAALQRLHGALKWPGPPPSDQDVERMRDEYLMEKYG